MDNQTSSSGASYGSSRSTHDPYTDYMGTCGVYREDKPAKTYYYVYHNRIEVWTFQPYAMMDSWDIAVRNGVVYRDGDQVVPQGNLCDSVRLAFEIERVRAHYWRRYHQEEARDAKARGHGDGPG